MTEMSEEIPMRRITEPDLQRFYELAPGVVQNRDRRYFFSEFEQGINYIVAGLIPILGVALWGWSASNWLIFLVVGCWVGLFCDVIRLHFLKKQIDDYCNRVVDDTFVSVIGEAVRKNQDEVPEGHIAKVPPYGVAIFVDLAFCGVSTLVILVSLPSEIGANVFDQTGFLVSMVLFFSYRLLMSLWEIYDHKSRPTRKPVVKLALGLRGASMFVIMFIVMIVFDASKDTGAATDWIVYVINGLLVAIGLMNFYGIFLMVGETNWLRGYLKDRGDQ